MGVVRSWPLPSLLFCGQPSTRAVSLPSAPMQVSQGKRKRLAAAIFDMTIKMYLRDNYIHGDLHGGNVLFSSDPRDDRVFVLDAGLTTALERDWASPFGYLLHALTPSDAARTSGPAPTIATRKRKRALILTE